MTLFRAEWKKLAGGKFLFLLLTLFAAAQGVLSYCLTPVDEYAEAYRKICSFAADDPEGFDRYYAELDAIRQEYDETISKMDPKTVRKANIPEPIYPCTVSGDPGLDDYALVNYYLRVTLRTEETVGKELDRVIGTVTGFSPTDALYGDGGLYLMRGASRFYRMDVQTGECISVTGDGWQKAE